MLQPKKTRYRKQQKGKIKGNAFRGRSRRVKLKAMLSEATSWHSVPLVSNPWKPVLSQVVK